MTDDRVSRRTLLGTGVAAGSFLLAGCSGGDSATPTGQPTVPGGTADSVRTTDDRTTDGGDTAELDSERPSAVVGQRIVDESVGFLVEGVDRRSQLAGRGEAPSGQEYLIVVLSVKNRGDDALEMGDLTDFRLTDGGGTTRERLRLVSQTGSQFDGGVLVPGETIRGFVAFEVAADSQDWSFVFDVDAVETDFERVTVNLAAQPQQPESRFRQSLRVPVTEVGANVTAADLTVTVSEVRTADSIGRADAGEGQEFVLPTVRVDNAKDRTAFLGLTGQMLLTNGRGSPQALDLGVQQQLEDAFPLNPNVPAGQHVEGEVPYVVTVGASPLYFAFDFTSNGAAEKGIWQLR